MSFCGNLVLDQTADYVNKPNTVFKIMYEKESDVISGNLVLDQTADYVDRPNTLFKIMYEKESDVISGNLVLDQTAGYVDRPITLIKKIYVKRTMMVLYCSPECYAVRVANPMFQLVTPGGGASFDPRGRGPLGDAT